MTRRLLRASLVAAVIALAGAPAGPADAGTAQQLVVRAVGRADLVAPGERVLSTSGTGSLAPTA